jgi:hypothetical protein
MRARQPVWTTQISLVPWGTQTTTPLLMSPRIFYQDLCIRHSGKISWQFLIKLNIYLPYDDITTFLQGIYPREVKIQVHTQTHTHTNGTICEE